MSSKDVYSFSYILQKYRKISFSEKDKGTRFEKLIKAFLKTYPLYQGKFRSVWLWNEFPYRKGFGSGQDIGIDLVAQTQEGDFWAIQCKCYDEDTYIDKPAVDSFLATSSKRFSDENLKATSFTTRLWISTTNKWNSAAENAIKNQNPQVIRLSLTDLENAQVDWLALDEGVFGSKARKEKYQPLPHQQKAIKDVHNGFKQADRGKLIMACGTGKTYTSLKIAEKETNNQGIVLFLVPSIALLGQTLQEWSAQAEKPINAICICSDTEVSKKKEDDENGGFSTQDLALPASTDVKKIIQQFKNFEINEKKGVNGSIFNIPINRCYFKTQKKLNSEKANSCIFDLIICDEAHRTTGFKLKDEEEKHFTKVHDNNFLRSKKRLYMTATPRLYDENSKAKAKEQEVYLCSMDDETLYGNEFYRIGFGEAVDKRLLSDYKVLVLTLSENQIPTALQNAITDRKQEINTDDASKLIGCINALSKRMLIDNGTLKDTDPSPMHKAVAFCQSIAVSKKITNIFNQYSQDYYDSLQQKDKEELVKVEADHIDGTMGASTREEKLAWLKSADIYSNDCRILTNVRCLSEGVDVPSLDAVMFLSAKNSQIDVVQSVGRVMRKAKNKNFGYIIIPVVIPANIEPEKALEDNDRFKVVWTVLNALRAHDDRFEAKINKLQFNNKRNTKDDSILVGGIADNNEDKTDKSKTTQHELPLVYLQKLQNAIYVKMVQKVGSKKYLSQWAQDVAEIAKNYIIRINNLISQEGKHKTAFNKLLNGLQKNINPFVKQDEVIEMLAQHLITKPVFEALFENYSFVENNPVSQALQKMVDLLEEQAVEKDTIKLSRFYEQVKNNVSDIDNAQGKQQIIIELYNQFFKTAFPETVEKLGIVYTPVEVVDFINNSVAKVLKKEFNRNLSDENIHILDPFTGTGTFITRLIQTGLISKESLERKYLKELHANEIVLLAYYIASVNIENAFHDATASSKYTSFNGICLTDTFQLGETDKADELFSDMLSQNSKRVVAQKKAPIRIIIGNPPYSVNNNEHYNKLEDRIKNTYAKDAKAINKNSLYDSYIKAFRWSSDRLNDENGGIIAFVSNAGWLDANAMDGFRNCLEQEFNSIYVFDLRGNQRTSGELSRKEGGKIFGSGSRTPVSITILVKKPQSNKTKATIHYHDIGDYLARDKKLQIVQEFKDIYNIDFQTITPDEHGDWLNKRDSKFAQNPPLAPEKKFDTAAKSFFVVQSLGLGTARDNWVYNYSKDNVLSNIKEHIKFYNKTVDEYKKAKEEKSDVKIDSFIEGNPSKISWSSSLVDNLKRLSKAHFDNNKIAPTLYRPFCKQNIYLGDKMIHRRGQVDDLFPSEEQKNIVICISGVNVSKEFSALLTDVIPDSEVNAHAQCFPLYYYEKQDKQQMGLFDTDNEEYIRRDGISDFIYEQCKQRYGNRIIKEDIFYYVYGFLHSKEYREKFKADLKKVLPHIPLVEEPKDFWAFSKAGRDLADLHLNYEIKEAHKKVKVTGESSKKYEVEKMRFPSKDKKDTIIYNDFIKIENIPLEAYDYIVNGKSAIEWIMERYQITIDKETNIKNNPNDWSKEHNNPRYILDLLLSVITVSCESVAIINSLPKVEF